ncbi:MAG TPA: hypothetical protein VI488_06500 [Candidatus Angelobacter sp.]
MKKRNQQKRGPNTDGTKGSKAKHEMHGRQGKLDTETQTQRTIARKLMVEYREVLEKLAKG